MDRLRRQCELEENDAASCHNSSLCGNRFIECPKPMLFAVSVDNVAVRENILEESNDGIVCSFSENLTTNGNERSEAR